jgi:WD40 repeat protein
MSDDDRIRQLLEGLMEGGHTPEQACATCPELLPAVRERWERVRRVQAGLAELFPEPADPPDGGVPACGDAPADLPRIPGYDVECLIGRGGTGVVYKARHLNLNRPVALKMLGTGAHAGPQELARFRHEAETVAGLRHAHIVQVYDVGDLDGCPYFTMEFVEGGSLADHLARTPQPARSAASMLATVATALEAAHRSGLVHRDLKPSNILLTADGVPKVTDFGLALRFGDPSDLALVGAQAGTPSYMAPEQALARAASIGPAVDVYALGAVLFEMLTGRPPFAGATAIDTLSQAMFHEPVPPSRLVPGVPRDLETICLKCLQKTAEKRYATAADLAADLGRFIAHEPIRARPVGIPERTWRWAVRHRALSAAMAAVAVLLAALVVGSLLAAGYFRALEETQRRLAVKNGQLASDESRDRAAAVAAEHREAGLQQEAEREGEDLRRNLYYAQMNLAGQAATIPSGIGRVLDRLAPWANDPPDLRGWEWYYLNGLCHRERMDLRGHQGAVMQVAWSPDGRRLASAGKDGTVRIWNGADGGQIVRLAAHEREVFSVAWSPDGRRLASGGWDHAVRVWDAASGRAITTFRGHADDVYCVAWSPDGTRLATCGADGTIQIWGPDTGHVDRVLRGHAMTVLSVAWNPDGRRLASGGQDATVRIWDAVAGRELLRLDGHINWVNCVAWNGGGTRLASASNDGTAKVWDAATGREVLTLSGHTLGVACVAWSPDGTRLATASDDQTVKVWSADAGGQLFTLRGHPLQATSVVWSPDGTRLASAGYDGTIKIWDAAAGPELVTLAGHKSSVSSVAWCPDGRRLASASFDGTVNVWDVPRRRLRFTLPEALGGRLYATAWSPDGARLASAGVDQTIRVWDAAVGRELFSIHRDMGPVFCLSWSPDGRQLASGSSDNTARVWDASLGEPRRVLSGHAGYVYSVAWSPDGRRLATASTDRTVRVWDAATGLETLQLQDHTEAVNSVAWSPDGQWIAAASDDQTVTISSASSGRLAMTLRGHTTRVTAVAWSPTGARLASASDDRSIIIWDAAAGRETLTLQPPAGPTFALAWSPDGRSLACGGQDTAVLIYDAAGGYESAPRVPAPPAGR